MREEAVMAYFTVIFERIEKKNEVVVLVRNQRKVHVNTADRILICILLLMISVVKCYEVLFGWFWIYWFF
jgi:hypothetical protein